MGCYFAFKQFSRLLILFVIPIKVFSLCLWHKCEYSSWSEWSMCSKTCGIGGVQSKIRYVTSNNCPSRNCTEETERIRFCKAKLSCCPKNCSYATSDWSPCKGCGREGYRVRYNTKQEPETCGGTCNFKHTETQTCGTKRCCPVNCQVGIWSTWSNCSASCNSVGSQVRTREIATNVSCNGQPCPVLTETKNCTGKCCPVDCHFSTWSKWSSCAAPSGVCSKDGGHMNRSRIVLKNATCGGKCGPKEEVKKCDPPSIPCQVSLWSEWGPCENKCSLGRKRRARTITAKPICHDQECPKLEEFENCGKENGGCDQLCSNGICSCLPGFDLVGNVTCIKKASPNVDGQWGNWSEYDTCTKTCGYGLQVRYRKCNNPLPKEDGKYCVGKSAEARTCNRKSCPGDGQWGNWTEFDTCTTTCGSGLQVRYRKCNNPLPKGDGKYCVGKSAEERICNRKSCPVDGQWGNWSEYDTCTTTCGSGLQVRYRKCNNPLPKGDGKYCVGKSVEEKICNRKSCPVPEKCNFIHKKVNCYEEDNNATVLFNDRSNMDWDNYKEYLDKFACKCHTLAYVSGFNYFGIRFYGICVGFDRISGPVKETRFCKDPNYKPYRPCNMKDENVCAGGDNFTDMVYKTS